MAFGDTSKSNKNYANLYLHSSKFTTSHNLKSFVLLFVWITSSLPFCFEQNEICVTWTLNHIFRKRKDYRKILKRSWDIRLYRFPDKTLLRPENWFSIFQEKSYIHKFLWSVMCVNSFFEKRRIERSHFSDTNTRTTNSVCFITAFNNYFILSSILTSIFCEVFFSDKNWCLIIENNF